MNIESAQTRYAGPVARQQGAMEYSDPPVGLDGVRLHRLGRLRQHLQAHDVAELLMFDQINTRYATDATNMQVWCSQHETRCVFVALDGAVVLFDYSNLPHLAADLPTIDEYRVLPSFYFFAKGPNGQPWAERFADQISDLMFHPQGR